MGITQPKILKVTSFFLSSLQKGGMILKVTADNKDYELTFSKEQRAQLLNVANWFQWQEPKAN